MGSSLLLKGGTSNPKNLVESISTASPHGFVVGDVVRFDTATSLWTKAQANSAENSEVAGVVSAVTNATEFDITYSGYISITSLAGVTSPVLFLDSTAAGGLTASPPSAIGMVVKPVLTKTSNGSGYIVSNYIGTQIGGSSTVAIDEIQPVGTIMPFAGSAIPDSWLACDGNSYAVSAYPNLYAKLQNSSGDRAPIHGYVVEIGVNTTTYATWFSAVAVGDTILYSPTQADLTVTLPTPVTTYSLIGRVIAKGTASVTVQIFEKYVQDSGVKNSRFEYPNVIPSTVGWVAAFLPVTSTTIYDNLNSTQRRANSAGQSTAAVSTVSVTHFNTPDLRGRFAIGTNTSALGDLEPDGNNYSAIAGLYPLGSQGGQEATPAGTGVAQGTYAYVTPGTNALVANMPPYTVVRYIIKSSPYTRAAIIDGLDLPYPNLLVSDLRDGTLRPGGSGEDLLFKTNTGSSGVERMRLTNDGRLGIGMSPSISNQMLAVSKDANANTRISVYNASTGSSALVSLHLNNNVTNGYVAVYGNNSSSFSNMTSLENDANGGGLLLYSASANGPIQFNVGGGMERMRLSKDGYLGIGSGGVSPAAALDVNGNGNQIWIRPGPGGDIGGGATAGLRLVYTPWNEGVIMSYDYTGSGTAKKLSLNPNGGAVGIGLTAPNDLVSLYVSQANNGAIAFGSQTAYSVLGRDGSNNMVLNAWSGHVFQMGGTEKVRFASDGKVGIGTNNPQQKFVVSNNSAEGIEIVPANNTNVNIIQSYNRTSNAYNTLDFRASDFKFGIGGTTKLTINSSGDVSIASATGSSSKNSGALIVAGGLGVAGAIYSGGLEASTVTASDTTASTTTTTGSLIVKGGAGIAGQVNAGGVSASAGTFTSLSATNFSLANSLSVTSLTSGDISSSGTISFTNATDATSSTSAALKLSGGAGIAKKLFVGSSTDSTSKITGALVVNGGAGISGAVYASNINSDTINASSPTDSTTTNSGAMTVAGGLGVAKTIVAAGITSSAIYVSGNTTSNSTSTGALRVAGGLGVAGTINTAGITTASLSVGSARMATPTGSFPLFAVRAWGVARNGGTSQPYFGSFTGGNLTYGWDLFNNVYLHVFTFVTEMPDANYSVVVTCQRSSGAGIQSGNADARNNPMSWAIKNKTTTYFTVVTRVDNSTSFENMESINVMVIR